MIIAVSGASGSLGKDLTKFIEAQGHDVIRISSSLVPDNYSSFSFNDLVKQKISRKIDIFFHLASLNENITEENIFKEIELTNAVLDCLPTMNCTNLIFYSTTKVYGDNSYKYSILDELSPAIPNCSYGRAKKLCEDLVMDRSRESKLNFLILRLPPVLNYSTKSNIGKLISLSKKIPLVSFVQGNKNKRSFISSENIEEMTLKILQKPQLISHNSIYNLADHGHISLNELLRAGGSKKIFLIPNIIFFFFKTIPIFRNILLKLYGNFQVDNSKITAELSVKLNTTSECISNKFK
ncbi:NADH(P)-binding protein, PF13460 family [SAR86 cluster bacterium SAR86E]|uniref:NADH(P)-binding protein, PF13460 family n=1 Tax=SAR86 cluster bacterium SAR86E TaxID=1208365 RepID=K6G4H5_9GAMM|nr:NADH(P)-binding protein, PF13460 family [SAR86 cluster bacterium SAR86E]